MLYVDIVKRLGGGSSFVLKVNFTAARGITALTGASGAGKTTTLRAIAGIITPDAGCIRVGAHTFFEAATRLNLPIQERRVGYVFQDYALFPHLTAEQNIAYGVKNADRKARVEQARAWLELFHIEHIRHRLPRAMSGGEQQRVALARALASDPALVLLDEPLSAVDVALRARLIDEIAETQARTAIPFLYVTHNEDEAARLGAQHIRLHQGQVAAKTEHRPQAE